MLVKTSEARLKTLKFCGELPTETQCMRRSHAGEDEDLRRRRIRALRLCMFSDDVQKWTNALPQRERLRLATEDFA
jgi:hypothetical protein